jgi:Na+/proline symporter
MSSQVILVAVLAYFFLLLFVGYITARKAGKSEYFLGNKESIWWIVAIGMLGDSMSGVSFISVPGAVYKSNFYYMQMVMGYLLGYLVIAFILLPLYYRMNLTSIYTYLETRFGQWGQKVGASYFVVSRLLGSAGRLYLTAAILQIYLFSAWNLPFWLSVAIIIALILVYTIKGGIRTLVFTDAIQSLFLVGGLVTCIAILISKSGASYTDIIGHSDYASWFNWNFNEGSYFVKHLLGGAFICIAMTGLDQNMMQKNLSCKSIGDAQKNILTYGVIVFIVNVIFVSLGAVMLNYLNVANIPMPMKDGMPYTDGIFPLLALNHLGMVAGIAFILGLAAATFSSADSVLTTLTTSTYIDLLNIDEKLVSEETKTKWRNWLHIGFAVLLLLCILVFEEYNSKSLIEAVLTLAIYTYGPLLGLFAVGILSKVQVKGWPILLVCVLASVATYGLASIPPAAIGGYTMGYEKLLLNGAITWLGLWMVSRVQN